MQEEKLEIVNSVTGAWKALFNNFLKFFVVFLLPILGYSLGLVLCAVGIFLLSQSVTFPNPLLFLILGIALAVCGLGIFFYFFWRFLVISASTYIVAQKLLKTGEKPEYKEANKAIEARAKDYIVLLLLLMIIGLLPLVLSSLGGFLIVQNSDLGMFLIFLSMLLLLVVNMFLILSVPFFALNENLSPKNCIRLSFSLISKNFWPTFGFLCIFVLTMIPVVLLTLIPILGTVIINFVWSVVSTPLIAILLTKWYLEVTEKTAKEEA